MVGYHGGRIVRRYCPTLLIGAIWQQLTRETVGIMRCVKCPVPNCGRWLLLSTNRTHREHCVAACRKRTWRRGRIAAAHGQVERRARGGVLPLQRSAAGDSVCCGGLDPPNIQKMARPTSRHSMLKPTINSISNVTVSAGVGAIRL